MMRKILFVIFAVSVKCDRRIFGGNRIKIENAPHSVAIHIEGVGWGCVGSLISENFVLTAAHCVQGEPDPQIFKIRAGSADNTYGGVEVDVEEVFVHPHYENDNGFLKFDFALLRIKNAIFPDVVKFIQLPEPYEESETGERMMIAGWGRRNSSRIFPQYLIGAQVPIYDKEKCNQAYGGRLTEEMICAGYEDGKVDACEGDSGSGIIRIRDNVIIGVTSFGDNCAEAGSPGVYAKVSNVRNWIHEIAAV